MAGGTNGAAEAECGAVDDAAGQATYEGTAMSAALPPVKPTATDTDAFLLRIHVELPAIRERATEVEQQGMISHEVIGWLTEADVFRAVQPRQWGGLELDLATFFEGAARIASACASTGWVASVVGIHPCTSRCSITGCRAMYGPPIRTRWLRPHTRPRDRRDGSPEVSVVG